MELSCDCGSIEITVTKPDQVTVCNCAICSRYQALWGYYSPGAVKVRMGGMGGGTHIVVGIGELSLSAVQTADA